MKKEYLDIISSRMGVQPIFINSAEVTAHNRQRFYWTDIPYTDIEKKEVYLNDILEEGYYCDNRVKSYCLDANYGKGTNFRRYYYCGSRQLVLEEGYIPSQMTKETANEVMHKEGNRWRKLSVLECERLQTVPEGYVGNVTISKCNKYKCLGNGWTVDVIAHIFSGLKSKEV